MPESEPIQPLSRQHLEVLTDDIGIMQHAIGSRPDPAHGYCTDDVARALQVDLLHWPSLGPEVVAESAWRSLRFLAEAFDPTSGRFRNFRRVDGTWLDGPGSDDSNGRAMLALGETIAEAPDARMVETAVALFERALPATERSAALRAQASVLLGCDAVMRIAPTEPIVEAYRRLATRLRSRFASGGTRAWPWPERSLTYENGLPVRALIMAGRFLDERPMVDAGLGVLDWLIAAQTDPAGHLSPIGNGWWTRGGVKSRFDQQPIEATALLLAAGSALAVTGDGRYRAAMELSYGWFLGGNDLGLWVADPARGACCDGLTTRGVNTNQGAESTLMWLIALEHIRAIRGGQESHEGRATAPPRVTPAAIDRRLATAAPSTDRLVPTARR